MTGQWRTYLVAYYLNGQLEETRQVESTAGPQDLANSLADLHHRNVYVWQYLAADPRRPHTADGWGVPA
jgi:hypothetical protein